MIQHKGTQNLTTKRLLLRRFSADDARAMFYGWANDSDVTRFLSWEAHENIAVTENILKSWIAAYDNLACYNWAIVFDANLVGSISLFLHDRPDEAEAGYCLSKRYWGMGIMAEALSAVLQYAFADVGFRRVTAKHHINNPNSGKVMRKCHMNYVETKYAPLALNPEKKVLCDCYEIINPGLKN